MDLLKIMCPHLLESNANYEQMNDEDLEKEKQRLLAELKESESVNRKSKNQNKM